MTDVLRAMEENSSRIAERVLFADGEGAGLTYGAFYQLTGRVYGFLKARGIGAEDFVLVCLPRGARPLVASFGVLRAGAAFVIVEDTLPADRIEYIRVNCGCKLVIDEDCWREILDVEPLDGYEPRDEHSAAFAVYTSGTTGAPKGVLHEYGNIKRMIASSPLPKGPAVARFALCSPLNFILSVLAALVLVSEGTTLVYIVPLDVVKDPMRFHAYLVENKITFSFLSPLFVKKMEALLTSLAFCVVGAEPANDLFSTNFPILNGYTMSEVGFIIGSHLIDRPYANTPVGMPVFDCPTRLLGEDGIEVAPGEKGEIVTWNPFVRGYINLPEKTAAAFRDGWYHTGDLGRYDEEGRLVVCGRLDDMAKINGNRVEPGEIEVVAREALGLSWAAAKVFTGEEKSFVCLYYLEDVDFDAEDARATMAEQLPYYMLPSFFIRIDEVPLTAAGKFNRRALLPPVFEGGRAKYCAPQNDVQRALCNAFSKALGVDKVGIKDDFARLGGDSLGAMEVVVASGLEGLSVADVYQGKTPEGIAVLYGRRAVSVDYEQLNEQALEKDFPLLPDQRYTATLQMKEPTSTMRSIHTLMKLDRDVIDMERMANALDVAARNHPALMTEFYRAEDGELRQRFSPELLGKPCVEHVSEEEFEQIKQTIVQPFEMIGKPLFTSRVFETEEAGYVFVDVHHTVFDGASYNIFLSDVMAAYKDGELKRDYYPLILESFEQAAGATVDKDARSYFEERYDGVLWCRHLPLVGEAKDSAVGYAKTRIPVSVQQIEQLEKQCGITRNGFFSLAAALSLAICTGKSDVMLFWSFNGRTNARELNSVGSLRSYLPLAFSFDRDASVQDLYASVNEQLGAGIAHCREPYLEHNPAILDEGIVRVLYQGTMGETPQVPGFIGSVYLKRSNLVSRVFHNLEITQVGDGFELVTKYTANCFEAPAIEEFARLLDALIEVLATHADDVSMTFEDLSRKVEAVAAKHELAGD